MKVDTPYYVLMDSNRRIGPAVVQLETGTESAPIYGFSDKGPYDRFCEASQGTLTPYPLVKGYLRNQVEAEDGVRLVVLDAASPCEACVAAATVEAVLQAHESRNAQVVAAYRLVFDPAANAYQVHQDDVAIEGVDEAHV